MNSFFETRMLSLVAMALLGAAPCCAAEARLLAGTHVALTLAHHITSSQTSGGSPVYFRVRDDILSRDGRTVIRKGTLVRGQMAAAQERGRIGSSGAMNFGVRFVPAVDGQNIRVIANLAATGRDRSGAVVGWTIFWGWFGLITKGMDSYALRGAELDAEVLSDKVIAVTDTEPQTSPTVVDDRPPVLLAAHSLGTSRVRPMPVNMERLAMLKPLTFEWPRQKRADTKPAVKSARVAAINGSAPIDAIESSSMSFDAWQILKYCDDGDNVLRFEVALEDGSMIDARYTLPIRFAMKQPPR
jgi:hypothetical protein